MIENIIYKQSIVYKENFLREGPCPKGVFWNNTQSQYLRFQRLFNQFPKLPDTFTIHDVGCGICDLHSFLSSKHINHVYSGTEIVQEMVDYSLKKYPGIQIQNRDILFAPSNEKYDVVVLSGTLNLFSGVSHENWRKCTRCRISA